MLQAAPPEDIEESRCRVIEAIRRFDDILANEIWLAGETFSLADIGVFATFCPAAVDGSGRQRRSGAAPDAMAARLSRALKRF